MKDYTGFIAVLSVSASWIIFFVRFAMRKRLGWSFTFASLLTFVLLIFCAKAYYIAPIFAVWAVLAVIRENRMTAFGTAITKNTDNGRPQRVFVPEIDRSLYMIIALLIAMPPSIYIFLTMYEKMTPYKSIFGGVVTAAALFALFYGFVRFFVIIFLYLVMPFTTVERKTFKTELRCAYVTQKRNVRKNRKGLKRVTYTKFYNLIFDNDDTVYSVESYFYDRCKNKGCAKFEYIRHKTCFGIIGLQMVKIPEGKISGNTPAEPFLFRDEFLPE